MTAKKPKIGIITMWADNENYGCVLQCYALQQALKHVSAEPFLIKYGGIFILSKKTILANRIKTIFSFKWKKIIAAIRRKLAKKTETVERGFEDFRNTYIESTDKIYSLAALKNNPPEADYYICGSDQIWNTDFYPASEIEGYFLGWGKQNIPRIAYAASFESSCISKEVQKHIAVLLKNFTKITVREQSGVSICKQMGIDNVECMPDPTLLLTAKHYEKLMPKTDTASDYILVYHLGNNIDFDNLKTFAKQKNIEKIVIVTGDNHVNGIKVSDDRLSILREYPTIQEWLSLMKNAKYIITDSFHGTVFSIIFNKNFGVYLTNGSGKNDRIYSLLDRLNLSEHIITNNLHILDATIDYKQVNKMVKNDSAQVLKSFEEWLKNE